MKKILIICMLFLSLMLTSCAKSEGLKYKLSSDGTYYIVESIGDCKDKDIVIPRKYKGIPVTTIGKKAFYNCEEITSVKLPKTITTIENSAFYFCTSLQEITIPKNVTKMGSLVFGFCDNLTIYCKVNKAPSGWDPLWNFSNRPVVWNK